MYKAKLLENTEADGDIGILKNAVIAVPLKYLGNFWKSLEMPLINCKVELKLKWTKYFVLSATGANNANDKSNKIIFTIKDTKIYVLVVTLSASDNQKQKLSRFERSIFWNKGKTKSENKNTTNEYIYFLE